jgi:hypothetical protein
MGKQFKPISGIIGMMKDSVTDYVVETAVWENGGEEVHLEEEHSFQSVLTSEILGKLKRTQRQVAAEDSAVSDP